MVELPPINPTQHFTALFCPANDDASGSTGIILVSEKTYQN